MPTKPTSSEIRARLAAKLGASKKARTVVKAPPAPVEVETPEVPLNDAPVTTTAPAVPYAATSWESVSSAFKRAIKTLNQADTNIAVELLKAYEYHEGLPSILFGQSTEVFRNLFVEMIQQEEIDGEPDLDKFPLDLVTEYKRLYDQQSSEIEEVLSRDSQRRECDNFRGRTVNPIVGDVIQGAYPALATDTDTMLRTSPDARYVVEATLFLSNRTEVHVRRIRLQNDTAFYNPRSRMLLITIGNGKNHAVNGVTVVAQLMRVFTPFDAATIAKLESAKE